MRICMIIYELLEAGGMEEIAVNLALSLRRKGHDVSLVSTSWVPYENQYLEQLRQNNVRYIQPPKWISYPASHWPTKERILALLMKLLTPLAFLLSGIPYLFKRRDWKQSRISAYNWLRGQISRFTAPDRRQPIIRLLLNGWRLYRRPDVIHIQGYTNTLLFAIDWASEKKIPVIYVENQTPTVEFNWWQDFNRSINKAALVVAASNKSAEALRSVCGVTQPIAVFNPNVPDPVAAGWRRNRRLREGNEALNVTTVARLYVTKGLFYLLEAIARVRKIYPETVFKVHGDGPLLPELLARAEQLGLDGERIFAGMFTRRELPGIMSETDLFVMSSILEGQPLAIVEAMAYECPIITTPVGGISELIEDGINGLLCPPEDPDCLARKICLLIEDPELRQRLARNARKAYTEGPFQPDSVGECFLSIYNKAIASK